MTLAAWIFAAIPLGFGVGRKYALPGPTIKGPEHAVALPTLAPQTASPVNVTVFAKEQP